MSDTTSSSGVLARVVTLHTSVGNLSIELYDRYAPQLCHAFYDYAIKGRYDGTIFHRLVPNHFIQGGALPTTSLDGSVLDDELHPDLRHTGAGVVSMANAGPDLNVSQFMITLSPQPKWDGVYSIVGRVSFGMEILDMLSREWTVDPATHKPYHAITITHCSCGVYPLKRRPLTTRGELRDSRQIHDMEIVRRGEKRKRSAVLELVDVR